MGGPGSYVHYGQDWAEVSNTPFALFKGASAEGGMRVPFIVHFPGRVPAGGVTDAFAYVTDFLPTVLDIAGIPLPGDDYKGQALLRPTGKSLLPLMEGRAARARRGRRHRLRGQRRRSHIHGRLQAHAKRPALRRRRVAIDQPARRPDRVQRPVDGRTGALPEDGGRGEAYHQRAGVVLPEAGYNPVRQLLVNNWKVLMRQLWFVLMPVALVVLGLPLLLGWWIRRRRRTGTAGVGHAA